MTDGALYKNLTVGSVQKKYATNDSSSSIFKPACWRHNRMGKSTDISETISVSEYCVLYEMR